MRGGERRGEEMTLRAAGSGRILTVVALALWVAAGVLLTPLAGRTGEVQSNDQTLTLPQSAEATRALIREQEAFPDADVPVAVVVYVRDSGIMPADVSAVAADRVAFAELARGDEVGPAIPSADGRALLLSFPIAVDGREPGAEVDEETKAAVDQIKDRLADAPAGLETAVTGSAGATADVAEAVAGTDTTLFLAAAAVVAVLLLITYRSPVLWLVPLLSVGLASQLAGAAVYLLGRYADVTVTEDSSGVMLVLVFGVGTDYALLLIARYREELRRHPDRYAAMGVAWRRSFPAILASAATVTVGMLCLLAAQMNDVRGLGPIAAAGIVVAFAVMTTLLPALLVLLGRWIFWPFVPRYAPGTGGEVADRPGVWHRLAATVGRRPRPIWILTTLALLALSFGAFGLRLGQSADEAYTSEVGSVVGQRLIGEHYAGGTSSPAQIIAAAAAIEEVAAAAAAVDGVAEVDQAGISADGRWTRIAAVLDQPPDSAAAKTTVDRLRDATHVVPGADALVGGETATILDIERASDRDNRVVMPLILLVVFVVLILLLRALVAPLLLIASVVLSYAAALGLAGLVFRAIGHPAVLNAFPLYGYLFLVTLGVDYTIFLMTRAREEVASIGNRDGILTALAVTGGVITSAGVVLAATFSTLVLLPLVTAVQMGLIVALGVLLDTFVVRTLLIPALTIDVGPRAWWPSRLAHRPETRIPEQPAAPRPADAPARVGG